MRPPMTGGGKPVVVGGSVFTGSCKPKWMPDASPWLQMFLVRVSKLPRLRESGSIASILGLMPLIGLASSMSPPSTSTSGSALMMGVSLAPPSSGESSSMANSET